MPSPSRQRQLLQQIANRAMLERGLQPEFSPAALAELAAIRAPAPPAEGDRDLRALAWCSIDNDDSRDLDQLSATVEPRSGGQARVLVAVADVDGLVVRGSAIDGHAEANTTSVYTPARIFPMLPERLSTDLTSLNPAQDRTALIFDMEVDAAGTLVAEEVYRGHVRNRAKLTYHGVGAWLEGRGPMPAPLAAVPGLEQALRLQDQAAQALKERRHEQGALDFETVQVRAVFEADEVRDLAEERRDRAKELIENLMVAANGVSARFLARHRVPSLRRVVRSPSRWERIVAVASEHGARLPAEPDSSALEEFLRAQHAADPLRFPDLSLTIIKLMGRGEYVVERPGDKAIGHFGLAVRDYTHSTAPNRRFPDLVTARLLKAALAGERVPYDGDELERLARHTTAKEDDAAKVERLVKKSAAACVLSSRIGERFDGIVTGASAKGTWVRIFRPPVEGRVERGEEGLDVGDRVRVKLVHTDIERGHIDFHRA